MEKAMAVFNNVLNRAGADMSVSPVDVCRYLTLSALWDF
jgi:hypothetical protein